jgi:type I restriction enzyme M protein
MRKDKKPVGHEEPMENLLFTSANKLRKNIDAAEYKHFVLGLIFLKYISDSFDELHTKLLEGKGDYEGADPEDPNEYIGENVFFVPEKARWSYLQGRAKLASIGQDIDNAMDSIEALNPSLAGVLPKEYGKDKLDLQSLGGLIDLIGTIALGDSISKSKDVLGRVYEYFLGQFALEEGKKGGQFYTPSCLVKLLVNLLEPYKGRVFDPCCGSGGMFVQSGKFVQAHSDVYRKKQNELNDLFDEVVSVYGQESNQTTWRLCKMNLAIRGIDSSNVKWNNEGSFIKDLHEDLKADYIIANPPFNDKDWSGELLKNDYRWKYGVPPVKNANFAWIQHFISHLAPTGKAGFLLATKALASENEAETAIRTGMISDGLPECIILLPGKLFYTTPAPVSLWILSRTPEKRNSQTLFIDASKIFSVVDRTHNKLSDEDIEHIASIYHHWISNDGTYKDVPGSYRAVNKEEILANGSSLYPGTYIGIAADEADEKDPEEAKGKLKNSLSSTNDILHAIEDEMPPLLNLLESECSSQKAPLSTFLLSDLLFESDERLGDRTEPDILTCTENAGLVLQKDRFSKRVATEDTSSYKIVRKNDIVYNPYLLWANAIDICTLTEFGITSPAYVVLRVKDGYSPLLIAHVLKSDYMKKWYWNISIGTHERRRTAPVERFLSLSIQLPSPSIQREIDELYAKADSQIDNLNHLKNALGKAIISLNEFYTKR